MKRILRYFRSRKFERELKAEMHAHIEERIDDLVEGGLTPESARVEALRQFGNRTRLAERSYVAWSYGWLDELGQNLQFAFRMLARNPIFAAVSILSLALGIGANSTIFGAVDQVLLRSLPYRQPEKLFGVWGLKANQAGEQMHVSAADFYDWQVQSHAFESLSAYSSWPMNLTNVEDPRRLETQLVSANLFSTLGVNAQMGRVLRSEEEQEQSPAVVVLSHRLWRELGGSPRSDRPSTHAEWYAGDSGWCNACKFCFPHSGNGGVGPTLAECKESIEPGRSLAGGDREAERRVERARCSVGDGPHHPTASRSLPGIKYRMERHTYSSS